MVGDADVQERFAALIDPLRFPERGLSQDDVVEIRRTWHFDTAVRLY